LQQLQTDTLSHPAHCHRTNARGNRCGCTWQAVLPVL